MTLLNIINIFTNILSTLFITLTEFTIYIYCLNSRERVIKKVCKEQEFPENSNIKSRHVSLRESTLITVCHMKPWKFDHFWGENFLALKPTIFHDQIYYLDKILYNYWSLLNHIFTEKKDSNSLIPYSERVQIEMTIISKIIIQLEARDVLCGEYTFIPRWMYKKEDFVCLPMKQLSTRDKMTQKLPARGQRTSFNNEQSPYCIVSNKRLIYSNSHSYRKTY